MSKFYYSILFFFVSLSLSAQDLKISGEVYDIRTGKKISNANVVIAGTTFGTVTNTEGKFALGGLKKQSLTIEISYTGYKTYKKNIFLSTDKYIKVGLFEQTYLNDEVVVTAIKANKKTPIAFTNFDKEKIAEKNLGQDIPVLLNNTPSVVVTTDAGAGVGYSGIRIRGTDPTRINVTINGIPLNDSESQGVYWVDMPDFASSVENIQIQRGVGTSTNGGSAFGATINVETNTLNEDPYGEINNSYGSFDTWKHTVKLGSGLIDDKFVFDGRLSKITSDGFIDRASSDLRSYYLSGGYYGKKSIIRANIFSGIEKTYQAWYGIPEAELKKGNRTYNSAGVSASLAKPYDNEIDDYQQDHYQLFYSYQIHENWDANVALHYTRGRGYYEQYRTQEAFADYGIDNLTVGTETVQNSDFIRRLWLDNHFYGTVASLNYEKDRLKVNIGGGWNKYEGKHYGEVVWAEYAHFGKEKRYYDNDAFKTDFNIYAKAFYQFTEKFNGYLDLQFRTIGYNFQGNAVDKLGNRNVQQSETLNFINPKIGVTYNVKENMLAYVSFGVGNKEPNRNDYTQSSPDSRPKHETLYNTELGIRNENETSAWGVNIYHMMYDNQLVLTGELNDVGLANRVNIKDSYRLGIELEGSIKVIEDLQLAGNFTFSQNKIQSFKEFIDDYDNGTQVENKYSDVDIAFSPNIVASGIISYEPIKNLTFTWSSKYVGEQFMDNTSNNKRKLDAFFVNDFRINYNLRTRFMKNIGLTFMLNNVLDEAYEPNGYTYSYYSGGSLVTENFYYPQAGRNFLIGVSLKF